MYAKRTKKKYDGYEELLKAIIREALFDLYANDYANKKSAEYFFKESNLFKMTGYNFEELKWRYEQIRYRKRHRIKLLHNSSNT